MTTKLTLAIEKEVIKDAKHFAEKHGRSLSSMVENFLKALVKKSPSEEDLSPGVKRIKGAVKLPKNFDYKKTLEQEMKKKHLK